MRQTHSVASNSRGNRRKSSRNRTSPGPVRLRIEVMEDRTVPTVAAAPLGPNDLALLTVGPSATAQAGDKLYFLGSTGAHSPLLWQTDGSGAGTTAVAAPGLSGLNVAELAAAGNTLYFTASAAAAAGTSAVVNVYKLDPAAPNGVTQVTNFSAAGDSIDLRSLGGHVYFTDTGRAAGVDQLSSQSLYTTDGTAAGTAKLADFANGAGTALLADAAAAGGELYFKVLSPSVGGGPQLWASDGTAANTHAIAGPGTAQAGLVASELATAGGKLFVTSADGSGDGQLWAGDASGLTLVHTFHPAAPPPGSSLTPVPPVTPVSSPVMPTGLSAADDGTISFFAADGGQLNVWSSDGTAAGTKALLDPAKLPAGFAVNPIAGLAPTGGADYFSASDSAHGTELWKTDGAGGAALVQDINPGPASAFPYLLAFNNGRVFFAADDGSHGTELWATDGTPAGTQRLTDLNPGIGGGNPSAVFALKDTLVVQGTSSTPSPSGPEQTQLWAVADSAAPAGAATTTALAVSGGGTTGKPVTLTATVTAPGGGAPTGSVQFRDEDTVLGSAPLANGQATFNPGSLAPGSHTLQAVYSGDATFAPSTSAPVSQSVDSALATTLALTTSDGNARAGETVTLTATIHPAANGPAAPGGSVTFSDGATQLGSSPVVNGVATLKTSGLSAGAHTIAAQYSGDAVYAGSTAAPLTQTVSAAPASTVTLTTSASTVTLGQAIKLTANVTPQTPGQPPGGTVVFMDGATTLASVALSPSGSATFSARLGVGTHTLTAVLQGSDTPASQPVTATVLQAATTTSLTSSAPAVAAGQVVTLTAKVAGPAGVARPTGTVKFFDGAKQIGSATLSNGQATYAVANLALGSHTLTAVYQGTSDFSTSTSAALKQTVTPAGTVATSTTIHPSASSVAVGQAITFTASVKAPGPGAPGGAVTFFDRGTLLGTGQLNAAGSATYTTHSLAAGSHTITAVYAGAGGFRSSSSAPVNVTIRPATATALTASLSSALSGQPVTLTAKVTAAVGAVTPGGMVTFMDGTTYLGTAQLQNGVATLQARFTPGAHAVTAAYYGNALFFGSNSGGVTVNVRKADTAVSLGTPTFTADGRFLMLSASVGVKSPGAGAPTGTMTFYDGSTVLGTARVWSNGSAALRVNKPAAGVHSLRAVYAGDGAYTGNASSVLAYTIDRVPPQVSFRTYPDVPVAGPSVTLRVVLSRSRGSGSAIPTGAVTFKDGATVLGTVPVANGGAVTLTTRLGVGPHTLTASYGGDANYSPIVADLSLAVAAPGKPSAA
jgi:ELWxxDGT repeat protein